MKKILLFLSFISVMISSHAQTQGQIINAQKITYKPKTALTYKFNPGDSSVVMIDRTTGQLFRTTIAGGGGGGSQNLNQTLANGNTSTYAAIIDSFGVNNGTVNGRIRIGNTVISGKSAFWFGDSQTTGGGCIFGVDLYSFKVSASFGWYNDNRAISGTKLTRSSAGDSSMIDRLYLIPVYNSATMSQIFFMYGANDRHYLGFDTVTYKTSYARIVDTCIARGWPLNRINIYSPSYSDNSLLYCPNMSAYAKAAGTIAGVKGVRFIDAYNWMAGRGANSLTCDSLHPGVNGASEIAYLTTHSIPASVDPQTGYLEVKGGAYFSDTTFHNDRVRIGKFTPNYIDPNYKLIVAGNTNLVGKLRVGGDFTGDLGNAIIQNRTSSNQIGQLITNGGADYQYQYAEFTQYGNVNGATQLFAEQLKIGSLSTWFNIVGGGGFSVIKFNPNTGIVINDNQYNGDLQAKGKTDANLFFAHSIFNRIGIGTATPAQKLSVQGSGSISDTLWAKSSVKFDGLPATLPLDTTGKKIVTIDPATGMLYKMNWPIFGGGGNSRIFINKLYDSIATSNNAGDTLKLKSLRIRSTDNSINIQKTITDTTIDYNISIAYDTTALYTFGAGAGNAGDTAAISTTSIYGSVFLTGSDTIIVTKVCIVMQGTSDTLTLNIEWNDSLNVPGTKLTASAMPANNNFTGNTITSFSNNKIPPNNYIWCKSPAVIAGRKPTYLSVTIIGYKKKV